jgi:hypothetical protein
MSLARFLARAAEIGKNPAAEGLHGLGEALRNLGIKLTPKGIERGRMTDEGIWLGEHAAGLGEAPAKSFRQSLSDDIAGLGDRISREGTHAAYKDPLKANALLLGGPLAAGGLGVGAAEFLSDDEDDEEGALARVLAKL